MRLLLLTRYDRLGASSRMRTFQYLWHLEASGWQIKVSPFFSDRYLRQFYNGDQRWCETVTAYLKRIQSLMAVGKYDLIWIEKELFPFLPALAEDLLKIFGVHYVVDFDDALFHHYDQHSWWLVRTLLGQKIDAVMKQASLVVAGNEYLARRAFSVGASKVQIVPTVIDLERYPKCQPPHSRNQQVVVGWIGTPWTSQYLYSLKNVFKSLKQEFDIRFVAVGASQASLSDLPVEAWTWSEENEVDYLRHFDIGIMPVPNKPWMRYKCGYKLIQYMGCSLPVVASPVGVNNHIVEHGVNGFLADDEVRWKEHICTLINDVEKRRKMGQKGREKVETWYCLQVQAPRLEKFLRQAM